MNVGRFSLAMWGERGLVATLFFDVTAAGDLGWQQLLNTCGVGIPLAGGSTIAGARLIVEPDFGEFGKPDAIVRLNLADGSSRVLIVEAKRGLWSKAASIAGHRGGEGYNSKLNGQLELNHALALALSAFREGAPELIEPDWILHTPYSMDRRGTRRVLKNAAVLQDVVAQFAGLEYRYYFHLVITADSENPMERSDIQGFMPEIYHPEFPFKNAWPELKGQFSWMNWSRAESLTQSLHREGRLPHGSYFAATVALNRRNMGASAVEVEVGEGGADELDFARHLRATHSAGSGRNPTVSPNEMDEEYGGSGVKLIARGTVQEGPLPGRASRGVSLIYAPKLNARTFVHFSWDGESCRLRDYSGRTVPQERNPGRRSMVEHHIEYEVQVSQRGHPRTDVDYWYKQIQELNRLYLTRRS